MSHPQCDSPALQVEGLCWKVEGSDRSGDPPILQALGLSLEAGRWLALSGPSGVGKTTFLSLCAGLLRPTSGSVSVFGVPLEKCEEEEVARLRADKLGLLFQNYHLDDTRSCLDNILLPGYFSTRPWRELQTRAKQLAERLGLSEHLDKPASVLSGGQRQRVGLARALLCHPAMLLADEPTGALDRETAEGVLGLLSELRQEGVTLVTVTHDPAVLQVADYHYTFSGGRLLEIKE